MKTKWITLKQLRIHEVHTTIRWLQEERISWAKRSEVYGAIKDRSVATFIKFVSPSIIGYLIATSLRSGNEIVFKVSNFEASLPASYFLFSLSVLYLLLLIALNNVSAALSLKSSIAGKITLPGFYINAYDALNGKEVLSLGLPLESYGYWRDKLRLTSIVTFLLSLSLMSLLIPIGALGYFLAMEQIGILLDSDAILAERFSSGFGLLSILSGVLAWLLFHTPMPYTKNISHVRWGFLWRLPIAPTDDERTRRWLDDD